MEKFTWKCAKAQFFKIFFLVYTILQSQSTDRIRIRIRIRWKLIFRIRNPGFFVSVSRLSTHANLGHLDTVEQTVEMGLANLALIQLQGIVVGGLAAFMAAMMAFLSSAAPFQVPVPTYPTHNNIINGPDPAFWCRIQGPDSSKKKIKYIS